MKNQKLIVIIGPTAAKKTTIAHQIALQINGAIINGDAFQVYQEINVGVNKPTPNQLKEVNYYLINHKHWDDEYSIHDFQRDFHNAYQTIVTQQQIPILCGGSHLYVDAIVNGYNLSTPQDQKLLDELRLWSTQQLYDYVLKHDPDSANKISVHNHRRLLRCVYLLKMHNNLPKSEYNLNHNNPQYETLIVMVNKEREELYNDINTRFDKFMFQNGWENEVKDLINKYPTIDSHQCFKALGYREIALALKSNQPINYELIKRNTRHLAKRQLTWCNNKFPDKLIFNYNKDNFDDLMKSIREFLND